MSPEGAPRVALIAAVAKNGVIGRDGQLPWHLPDDLKRFKSLTMGHAIIMGRKTFESIGKALPGRQSIVVSSTPKSPRAPGIEVAPSLDAAIALATGEAFIIGGAALYAEAIARANTMHLTELDEAVEGDTYFPPYDRSQWRLASEERHERDERRAMGFRFCTYERK